MTEFFEQLSQVMADGMTVNITAVKKGEKLSVIFTPIPKDKKKEDITPFVITGTGREIDVTFNSTMLVGTAHHSGLQDNAAAFLKDSGMESVFDQTPEKKTRAPRKKKEEPVKPVPAATEHESAPIQAPVVDQEAVKESIIPVTPDKPGEMQPNKEFDNPAAQGQPAPVNVGQNISKPAAAQIQQPAASPQPAAKPAPVNPAPQPQTPPVQNPSDQW